MRRIVAVVLVAAAAITTAAVLLTESSARESSARDRIVTAALAQKSAHYTRTVSADMIGTFTSTADVNADSGAALQRWFGGGTVRIRLVNGTVYVQAYGAGIHQIDLTPAQERRYVGRWISITRKGDEQLYDYYADGLTLASIVHDVTPSGTVESSVKTSNGTRFLVVRGTGRPEARDLTATATGTPLPVLFSSGPTVGGDWGRFGRWNEPVHVRVPAHSIPITTVRGG